MTPTLAQSVVTVPTPVISLGPFFLSREISLTGVATLITITIMTVKLISHLTTVQSKINTLWKAMMGVGPEDYDSFFNRFNRMEIMVKQLWERRRETRHTQ